MLRKTLIFYLLWISFASYGQAPARLGNAITHGIPLGRVGDYLLGYIKAKYISFKYGINFLLNPPKDHHAELQRLEFYKKEKHLTDYLYVVDRLHLIKKETDMISDYYYVIDHNFSADAWKTVHGLEDVSGWHDVLHSKKFRDVLRDMIKLSEPADQSFFPPKDRISIAMHIRTGQFWDTDGNRNIWYFKFPTIDFYIRALKHIAQLFPNKKLLVSVFSDDPDPFSLVKVIMNKLDRPSIKFRCRSTGNLPNRFVLEDLEAMKQYDCLIRGMSGFAQVAQILGDYKIVIYPEKFNGRQVTKLTMVKKDNYRELLKKEKKL